MADDPDLNRRVAQFLLKQNEIAGRVADAMMAKDVRAMNLAAQELADLNAAHQDLAEDTARYKANTGSESSDATPAPAGLAKPRRTRKPTKQPQQPSAGEAHSGRLAKKSYTGSRRRPGPAGPRARPPSPSRW